MWVILSWPRKLVYNSLRACGTTDRCRPNVEMLWASALVCLFEVLRLCMGLYAVVYGFVSVVQALIEVPETTLLLPTCTAQTQGVSHRPIKCQPRSRSQSGTKVNGSHHGDNPLLKPTGIQIATKSLPAPTHSTIGGGGGGVTNLSPFWEETARKQPIPGTYLTNPLVKCDKLGASLPTIQGIM